MSDTPRTDAQWCGHEAGDFPRTPFVVPLEFARQLEREAEQLRSEVASLKETERKFGTIMHAEMDKAEQLRAENAKLKTVMIAAAEEIHEHWDAHCDAEGYGPANLMRRLEDGIPSEYGYTAGSFNTLRAENAELLAALRRLLPRNLGPLPDHLPDDTVFPVDMTAAEIRDARALLAKGERNG